MAIENDDPMEEAVEAQSDSNKVVSGGSGEVDVLEQQEQPPRPPVAPANLFYLKLILLPIRLRTSRTTTR